MFETAPSTSQNQTDHRPVVTNRHNSPQQYQSLSGLTVELGEPRSVRKERQDREDMERVRANPSKDRGPSIVIHPDGSSTVTNSEGVSKTNRPAPAEPEREMKADGLEKNVEKERVDTGPTASDAPEKTSEPPAPGSMKERMAKINERNAEQAKERERNPDADRDR